MPQIKTESELYCSGFLNRYVFWGFFVYLSMYLFHTYMHVFQLYKPFLKAYTFSEYV